MGTSGTWAMLCLEPRTELSPKWGVKAGLKPLRNARGTKFFTKMMWSLFIGARSISFH
jgi:hypothetical protein